MGYGNEAVGTTHQGGHGCRQKRDALEKAKGRLVVANGRAVSVRIVAVVWGHVVCGIQVRGVRVGSPPMPKG